MGKLTTGSPSPTPATGLLSGHRGLILGVSSRQSVGFHCLKEFLAQGARVAIAYRERAGGEGPEIARSLDIPSVAIDVQREEEIRDGVARAAQSLGGLDFLVHTLVHVPEGGLVGSVLDITQRDLATVMDVGVRSLLSATRHALSWLEQSHHPRVVTLLSHGGDFAIPNYHLLGISKAALKAALHYMAQDLGARGILCNGVAFSMVNTDAATRVLGADTVQATQGYLRKRSMTKAPVEPAQVARAVSFLASSACQNITAEVLNVDGGYCKSYF